MVRLASSGLVFNPVFRLSPTSLQSSYLLVAPCGCRSVNPQAKGILVIDWCGLIS